MKGSPFESGSTSRPSVRQADWSQPGTARAVVVERMTRLVPTDELRFLMELSIDPVAARLGVVQTV
jgi:hypothetical protein